MNKEQLLKKYEEKQSQLEKRIQHDKDYGYWQRVDGLKEELEIVLGIINDIKNLDLSDVMVELPKWKTCNNCDCGEFPVRRCDCSCHD